MKLQLGTQNRIKNNDSVVKFILYKSIEVTTEVYTKSLLTLVADIGGYLGLTLGISLLDLKTLISPLYCFITSKIYSGPSTRSVN